MRYVLEKLIKFFESKVGYNKISLAGHSKNMLSETIEGLTMKAKKSQIIGLAYISLLPPLNILWSFEAFVNRLDMYFENVMKATLDVDGVIC